MGVYLYRATTEIVTDKQGRKANRLEYAYKPSWDDGVNNRLHFRTGCYASERLVDGRKFTGRVAMECDDGEYESLQWGQGTILDDLFWDRLARQEAAHA